MMRPAPSPEHPGVLNWILIGTLGLIWGAAFLSVTLALEGFPPATVAAARCLIAALALCLIGQVLGQGLEQVKTGRAWSFAAAIGAGATALPFFLLSWGQQFVPSAFAGVAMGAVPLLVLPLAALFSPEEGIGPRRITGMGLGFAGILVLLGPDAFASGSHVMLGQLACLGAAGCYAIGSITTRRAPKVPPIAFSAAIMCIATAILTPVALITDGLPTELPLRPGLALLWAALFPTALAAVIRVRVITTAGSVFMSLTSYMVPVWSVILGIALLSEELPPRLFLALGLILAGIAISQSRHRKR